MQYATIFLRSSALIAAIVAVGSAHATCWDKASTEYGVPALVLKAVAKTESNFNAAALNRNRNGTYDIGMMQVNSSWLKTLDAYGITERDLKQPCTNVRVGAWILANNAARYGWNWNAIGAYNVGCATLGREECSRRRNNYAWKIHTALQHADKQDVLALQQPNYESATYVSRNVAHGAYDVGAVRKTVVVTLASAEPVMRTARIDTEDASPVASDDYTVGDFLNYADRHD